MHTVFCHSRMARAGEEFRFFSLPLALNSARYPHRFNLRLNVFSPQEILQPASTTRHCPVISALSSEARNTAVPVNSRGWSERPSADWPTRASRNRPATTLRVASDIVTPGAIAFTRILYLPKLSAIDWVI